MIDLHSHVLPGVDDGPATLEESVAMLQAMEHEGVELVAATPHVREDYPTSPSTIEAGIEELREALDASNVTVEVRTGAEIAVDWLTRIESHDLARYGLAGNPRAILLEFPYLGWPMDVSLACNLLLSSGVTPVLAHPERNDRVQAQPERLEELVSRGALVQLTASSFTGRRGSRSQRAAERLLDLGLAHLVGSDAHRPQGRAGLSAAAEALGRPALAAWLLRAVPSALVQGGDVPPRPEASRSRRPWWRRRLRGR